MSLRRAALRSSLVLAALSPRLAYAAPTPADLRAARSLFASAEKDEDESRWQDALDKLDRVAAVKLTAGVRYHIALCEEKLGKLSAGLADFEAAERQAQAENAGDVIRLVGAAMAPLVARVPRIAVHPVPDATDVQVVLDGVRLPGGSGAAPLRVDPGEHAIDVTAPGRLPGHATVTVRERESTTVVVALPVLVIHPVDGATTGRAVPASPGIRSSTPAWLATVSAAALGGGGLAAYVIADDAHSRGVQECKLIPSSNEGACGTQRNTVRAWDWVAASAWAGAVASTGIAVLLWTRADSGAPARTATRLRIGPRWMSIEGGF